MYIHFVYDNTVHKYNAKSVKNLIEVLNDSPLINISKSVPVYNNQFMNRIVGYVHCIVGNLFFVAGK